MGKKENVLRVKKDEADARASEEEKSKRALLAVGSGMCVAYIIILLQEQEARTVLLREKVKQKSVQSGLTPSDKPQHINFFYDVEQGVSH